MSNETSPDTDGDGLKNCVVCGSRQRFRICETCIPRPHPVDAIMAAGKLRPRRIDTAPKDGTPILVRIAPAWGSPHWTQAQWSEPFWVDHWHRALNDITHWCELPENPA
jgi:hypothetical protein